MARIVVTGYMIRHPVAGNLLAYFHYVLGLYRLGHEVVYLEESGWLRSCYDPTVRDFGDDPSTGLRAVRLAMAESGLPVPIIYVNRESGMVYGAEWDDVRRILRTADLLLNIGGVCWLPEFRLCHRRALIDMDPLFTQLGGFWGQIVNDHDVHFTYGANIGRPGCTVPSGGVDWLATVPPVVLELWNVEAASGVEGRPFTTVANWSAYGGVIYRSEHYGQKDEEFLRLLDLPGRTAQPLELALSGADAGTTARLHAAGWSVRDAQEVSADLTTYRDYIGDSRGELSVAKHAYVKTQSGWFSDRSVCYLAAGRPAILQNTGFDEWLPTGHGVLTFSTVDQAADCLERVNADYSAHRSAAREIAERTFSHQVVLPRLLDAALGIRIARPPVISPGCPS